jgi:cyclic pyranopterin phosphate synthase
MHRTAIAAGTLVAASATLDRLIAGDLPKGEALAVARIAGIQAAKRCDALIPLCHTLPLDAVSIDFDRSGPDRLQVIATTTITARTGVEMEALTGVSVALLTLWDMVKGIDADLRIDEIRLIEKRKEPTS